MPVWREGRGMEEGASLCWSRDRGALRLHWHRAGEEQRGAASWHVWRGRVESTVYAVVVVVVAREGGGRPCDDVVRAVPAHCLASIAWLRTGVRQRGTALLLLRGDCSWQRAGGGRGVVRAVTVWCTDTRYVPGEEGAGGRLAVISAAEGKDSSGDGDEVWR